MHVAPQLINVRKVSPNLERALERRNHKPLTASESTSTSCLSPSFAATSTTTDRKATTTCLRPIYHRHHHSSSQKRSQQSSSTALPCDHGFIFILVHDCISIFMFIICLSLSLYSSTSSTVLLCEAYRDLWLNVIKPGDITRKFTFPALNFWFKCISTQPRVGHSRINACGRLFPCAHVCNSLGNSTRLHKGPEEMAQKGDRTKNSGKVDAQKKRVFYRIARADGHE